MHPTSYIPFSMWIIQSRTTKSSSWGMRRASAWRTLRLPPWRKGAQNESPFEQLGRRRRCSRFGYGQCCEKKEESGYEFLEKKKNYELSFLQVCAKKPPLFIFKGATGGKIEKEVAAVVDEEEATAVTTPNGWMNGSVMLQWVRANLKGLKDTLKV